VETVNVKRRLSIAAAMVVVAAPALSACGFALQTDQVYNPAEGVDNRSGQVDILNALIVADKDRTGTVIAGLANNNQTRADQLVDVSAASPDRGVTVSMGSVRPKIPAAGYVQLADLPSAIAAKGTEVEAGRFVTLRFTFQNAESVTMDVPVVLRTSEYAGVPKPTTPAPSPTKQPKPTSTASPAAS
jgi:hypothetical protein